MIHHINATEAKTHFGEMLDKARTHAVMIDKNGRSVAVMLSKEAYEKLQGFEDSFWATQARHAKEKGFLSEQESEALLQDLLDA